MMLEIPSYQFIDVLDATRDVGNRILCAVYSETFFIDPSRIIRAIRYRHALNFKLEKGTEESLQEALSFWSLKLKRKEVNDYCIRRITREIKRSLEYSYPSQSSKQNAFSDIAAFLSSCDDTFQEENFDKFFIV